MPNHINSPTATQTAARRPFDGIVIALSAALLVIFGVVIGRFVVTSEAVEVVDRFDLELTTLRAEIVDLNRKLLQSNSQIVALQQTSDGYRELATLHQTRADRLADRQIVLADSIKRIAAERETCLTELHQYAALNQPIPATDVLRFAKEMFDAHSLALHQLSDTQGTTIAALPSFPQLHVTSAPIKAVNAEVPAPRSATSRRVAAVDGPRLAPPLSAPKTQIEPTPAIANEYFTPPKPRRAASGYTFFAPNRSPQIATFGKSSGVTIHEAADASEGVRR